jgi:hypothetical protein
MLSLMRQGLTKLHDCLRKYGCKIVEISARNTAACTPSGKDILLGFIPGTLAPDTNSHSGPKYTR